VSDNKLHGTIPVGFALLPQIKLFTLHTNKLVGPLPFASTGSTGDAGFIQWPLLEAMDLSTNALTGTISARLSLITGLRLLVLKGNRLVTSPREGAFAFIDPARQTKLETLDVSDNELTGIIPERLFELPALQILSAGSNCFSGSLPSSICNAVNLSTIVITDMSSSDACRLYFWRDSIFKNVFDGWTALHFMEGSLPECVYRLPNIKKLKAAGNGFTGRLPDTIASTLTDLDISRNKISGSISKSVAVSPALQILDLSNNRISGNLTAFSDETSEFYTNKDISLSLSVNRLSGNIPTSLKNVRNMSILAGNLFSCAVVPQNDVTAEQFQCGSADLNAAIYAQIVFILAACLTLFYIKHSGKNQRLRRKLSSWLEASNFQMDTIIGASASPLDISDGSIMGVAIKHMKRYSDYLRDLRVFVLKIGILFSFVFIMYLSLSGTGNRTVEYLYAWMTTALYLSGNTSTICLLVSSIVTMLVVWNMIRIHEKKTIASSAVQSRESKMGKHAMSLISSIGSIGGHTDSMVTTATTSKEAVGFANTFIPFIRLFLLLFFSSGVIFAGNGWYVEVQLEGQTAQQNAIKFGFALFKLFWSMTVFPNLLKRDWLNFGVDERFHDRVIRQTFGSKTGLLFVMNVTMTFIIPMFAVTIADPTCFYRVFVQAPLGETTYGIRNCEVYYLPEFGGACAISGNYEQTLAVAEPYFYNYTCSSSILRVYIPLYQQMYIILVLRSLFQFAYLCWDICRVSTKADNDGWLHWMFIMSMPTRFLLQDSGRRQKKFNLIEHKLFPSAMKEWMIMSLPSHLSSILVLLAFGFLAPPLALMIIFSILLDTYIAQLILGRFLTSELGTIAEHQKLNSFVRNSIIEHDITESMTSPEKREKQFQDLENTDKPWGALAVMRLVEKECRHVPESTFAVGRATFILVPSVLFALVLNDVQNNSSDSAHTWAAAAIEATAGALLVLSSWVIKLWDDRSQLRNDSAAPDNERPSASALSIVHRSEFEMGVRNPITPNLRFQSHSSESVIE